jgi:intracellular septation protein
MAERVEAGRESAGGKVLTRMAVDFLSGLLFLALFLTTNDIFLATALGVAFGLGQALWMISRKQKVDPMQWMVLALILVLGSATILTRNPTFVVFKPSIFEAGLAAMMLRPRWNARYAPEYTRDLIPPGLVLFWGYFWAAAWFALAASNLVVARAFGLRAWAIYTSFSPWVLVGVLTGLGILVFPPIVRREARARGIDLKARRANG